MVVVDQDAPELAARVDEIALQVAGPTPPFAFHLFDRRGYDSLVGLLGETLGRQDPVREPFRSPSLPLPADRGAEVRVQAAREVRETLARSGERLRLARLMAGGGFAAETAAPLRQALDAILTGLYKLSGEAVPADPRAIVEIERRLVKPGILSPEDSARIPWMQSLLAGLETPGAAPLEPPLVERMAATVERLGEAAALHLTARSLTP